MKLRKGVMFEHRSWLDSSQLPNKVPLRCIVTAVRQGVVYYRPHYGFHDDGTPWLGSSTYFSIEDAEKYVGKLIES